jgi:hypothetical protein
MERGDMPTGEQDECRCAIRTEGELEKEVRFRCKEHAESFRQLTHRQQVYIEIYMRTGSPKQVAKEMGLSGSVSGVCKRLTAIAQQMGLSGLRCLGVQKESTSQSATASQLMKKIKSQGFRCALSGIKLTPETSHQDHIVPLSNGGTNHIDNIQWLDARVNKAKGTMSQAEFIQMCHQVSQWSR